MATKICHACETEKPLSEFYFHDNKPLSRCKECWRKACREQYHNKRVKDIQFHVDRLLALKQPQRFNAAIALYDGKTLLKGELRTLLQSIDF